MTLQQYMILHRLVASGRVVIVMTIKCKVPKSRTYQIKLQYLEP